MPLLHRRMRLQGLHLGHRQAGNDGPGPQQVRRRPRQAAAGRNGGLVRTRHVQRGEAGRQGRPRGHQARQELRREFRPRLDPRRADGRDVLFAGTEHAAAAPHRPDGLALRADAADELGGRPRPRRPGHRGHRQRAGRGRPLRLRLRSRRSGRRLREHLGHRQALFRGHEGQEHPDPQPPRLQLRSPRHPRHGRRRAQQLL